jgi:putative alpha-1,2-mannosidase
VYFITTPFFPAVSITNPLTNATATIRCVGFEGGRNTWIQSAWLDGEVWTRNWIGHEFFTRGGVLELVLGSEESEWGTGVGGRPPSMEGGVMEL